jgi:hypothetical protein
MDCPRTRGVFLDGEQEGRVERVVDPLRLHVLARRHAFPPDCGAIHYLMCDALVHVLLRS